MSVKKHTKNHLNYSSKRISRKEAVKKIGLTALTTATLFFLETKQSAAQSKSPTWPGGGRD